MEGVFVNGVPYDVWEKKQEQDERTKQALQMHESELSKTSRILPRPTTTKYVSHGEFPGFVKVFSKAEIAEINERSRNMTEHILRRDNEKIHTHATCLKTMLDWTMAQQRIFDLKLVDLDGIASADKILLTPPNVTAYLYSLGGDNEELTAEIKLSLGRSTVSSKITGIYKALVTYSYITRQDLSKLGVTGRGSKRTKAYHWNDSVYQVEFSELLDIVMQYVNVGIRKSKKKDDKPETTDIGEVKELKTYQYVQLDPEQYLRYLAKRILDIGMVNFKEDYTDAHYEAIITMPLKDLSTLIDTTLETWESQLQTMVDNGAKPVIQSSVAEALIKIANELPKGSSIKKTAPDGTCIEVKRENEQTLF